MAGIFERLTTMLQSEGRGGGTLSGRLASHDLESYLGSASELQRTTKFEIRMGIRSMDVESLEGLRLVIST